jgi:hypothetical protein
VDALPESLVRMVPRGGTRTPGQIKSQLSYFSQNGKVEIQRSRRHQGTILPPEKFEAFAESWAMQTGIYQKDEKSDDGKRDLTTHMFVSFPPGTDAVRAHAAARDWVEHVFGSGENGDSFDYVTAFHTNRPHPHLHIVFNRRSFEGNWLKISSNHPQFGYQLLRGSFVDIAHEHGLHFAATTRAERGLLERPLTYAQYRREAEELVVIENEEEEEEGVVAVPTAASRRRKADAQTDDIDPRQTKRIRQKEHVARAEVPSPNMPDMAREAGSDATEPVVLIRKGSSLHQINEIEQLETKGGGQKESITTEQTSSPTIKDPQYEEGGPVTGDFDPIRESSRLNDPLLAVRRRKPDKDVENADPRPTKRRRADEEPTTETDPIDRSEADKAKNRSRGR